MKTFTKTTCLTLILLAGCFFQSAFGQILASDVNSYAKNDSYNDKFVNGIYTPGVYQFTASTAPVENVSDPFVPEFAPHIFGLDETNFFAPPVALPGKIQAESWDARSGGMYAMNTNDVGGGQHVVGIANGNYMDYNVTVAAAGVYNINFRAATTQNNAQFQVKSGTTILGSVNIPNTGDWSVWQTKTLANVTLAAGAQVIRLTSTNNESCNFNWFEFVAVTIGNQPPVANAGSNQTITLPTSTATISGSATDADGTIASYAWTQTGGTAATITTAGAASTTITGLTTAGVRTFRLTATDNEGATGTSDVTVTVSDPANILPTANAGTNQTITLPTSSVSLSGSGADADGTITGYAWSQTSGTAATITTPGAAATTVTGLTTSGVRVFKLTVTDNSGATATSNVTITVNPGNQAPVANAGTNQTIVQPTSSVTVTGTGSDADGTIASYAWSQVNGTAATITTPGAASTTITGLTSVGPRVFRLTVTDNQGAQGTSDVTISVNPLSNGKTLPGKIEAEAWDARSGSMYATTTNDVGGGQHVVGIANGNYMDYNVTVTSAGTYTVGFRAATTQAHAQFQIRSGATILGTVNIPNTGDWNIWQTANVTGIVLNAGVQTIRIQSSNTESCNFNWMDFALTAANQTPTANAGTAQTITLPTNSVSLSGTGADADGTIASYAWSQVNGTAATITTPGVAATTITGLTTAGVRTFRLTVTDNQGATGTNDVIITVNPANVPPTANAGTNQLITLPTSTVSLTGVGTDADGTIASYAWTQTGGTTATITTPGAASTTITGLTTSGVRTFHLVVTDNQGATASSDVTVTVNQAPTASAGANQTIILPASTVNLSGTGTDADGTISTYAWTQTSGTAATINSPSAANTSITGLTTSGVRVFKLTVTDNLGATATSSVTITVNQAPIAVAGADQSINLPISTTTLNGSGTDADGTIATYAWSQVSGAAATITTPGAASTNITGLTTSGLYVFRLTVTDNLGATGTSDITITVNPVGNQLPTANAGTDQLITLPTSTLTLSGSGTDADGTIDTYAWSQVSGTAAVITTPGSASTTVTGLTTGGIRVFRLTVTDNQGGSASNDVTITVNKAPVANAGSNQFITPPTTSVSLTGSGTDADGSVVNYAWTQVSGTSATITNPGLASTTITGLTTAGARVFRLTVTDNQGGTGTSDVTVTVNTAPTAAAGANQLIVLPTSTVTLNGSGTDVDGTIASYAWSQVSGTSATITTPGAASTSITGLTTSGVRVFRLTVTDNQGGTGTSDVTITVNSAPVANAGTAQTINLPVTTASLTGSGTDADGTITTYAWTQTSGTAATITTPGAASTTITGLSTSGARVFKLTVTDNLGSTATSSVTITVNASPVVNAGTSQTIVLPTATVSLSGSATDADGTITTYAWSQVSGTAATITTPGAAATTVTGLSTVGVRVFRLTATDNLGATNTSDVTINVTVGSIIDPSDILVTYKSSAPPVEPAAGQIGKWVRTVRMTWNTDAWKAYIINGMPFRIKFPKTYNHTANDGKRYPFMVFLHGRGESDVKYDNEFSMANGGPIFDAAVNSGAYDGFILIAQNQSGWSSTQLASMIQIIDYMVINNKVDPFAISVNGLSDGGFNSWGFMELYPSYTAAALPMSGVVLGDKDPAKINNYRFTPIWLFQGGQDTGPAPYVAADVYGAVTAAGGNMKYTLYPNLGHGTWSTAWAEPDFFAFAYRAYSANPWTLTGRTEFCPGDVINATIGVAPGYTAYEWKKDGVIIPGATSNSIQATAVGTYSAHLLKGTLWSDWSRVPVVIKIKTPTVSPNITISGLMSNVIPALDTTNVTLKVPSGYVSYVWQKVGNATTIGTDSTLNVSSPGNYAVKVTEQFGCSSSFSTPFTVVDANGTNKPSPAANLGVSTLSKTSLRLDWSENLNPQFNETNYEIYQSLAAGGASKLVAITGADITTATITGLNPKTVYYYKVRAVNGTSASAASNEASAETASDTQAPTAPTNLVITSSTRTSISLSWSPSTDDVGVVRYYVYVNGVQSYPTTGTTFTVNDLIYGTNYNFSVKAVDFAGNFSPASNQVTGQPLLSGLSYKYYTFTGQWDNLPDFSLLTPDATGFMPNVSIAPSTRHQDDNFGFLWEGYLKVTTAGVYNFRTNSDDGSRLYLGALNGNGSPYSFSATPLVNNDGLHGPQDATSANITLAVGTYPIAMTFYEQGGGEVMTVSWNRAGGAFSTIPDAQFVDAPVPGAAIPNAPSNLIATAVSYKKINLTWTDNSANETGFEVWRSTNASTGFIAIGIAPANAPAYSDSVNLLPSTIYYYQVRAIGQGGESAFTNNLSSLYTDALWKFNNNYIDSSVNGRTLTPTATPTFDASNKKEGTHAIVFNGTSQYATPASSTFLQTAYTQKTIAFWMKSNSNTGTRVIADIGGSDDGLALLLDASKLYAGVASNSVRTNISIPYAYANTVWNHVALVYNTNSLQLYLNGALAVSSSPLAFTSVGTTTGNARIGTNNSTNAFNTGTGFFSGSLDNFGIYSKALTQADIINLMNNTPLGQSFDTTFPLPSTPIAPSALLASGTTTTKVNVAWTDNDATSNEAGLELYRSSNTNANYLLLATLPAHTVSFVDSSLFSNSIYYYKLRATGIGSNSGYTNEDSAVTKNNIPVVTPIANQSMHYQSTMTLDVNATDSDAEYLTISVPNLPAMATLQQTVSGTAQITFNPNGVQGTYNNIQVKVTDAHGASSSTTFNLVVNDNFKPTITAIPNYNVTENDSISIPLSAQDQNAGDVLTWSVADVPYVTETILPNGGNGLAILKLRPNYAAAGVTTVTVSVNDGNGGVTTSQFTLTVTDKNPITKIYARAKFANTIGAPWNSLNGPNTSNLVDDAGHVTNVGVNFQQQFWLPYNGGPTTGNNSGVYPDAVLNDFWYFGYNGGPETAGVAVTGLDPATKYNLTFFAASVFGGANYNGTTIYSVGAQSVSLYVQNNTQNTVSINNITPAADGSILVNMAKGANTPVGYLNAIVVTSVFDDGTAPVAPTTLAAQNVSGQGVKLTWQDIAYNETAYEVYRATGANGTFSLIGSLGPDATTYTDGTVTGGTMYQYKVKATNGYGSSPYSNVVAITTIDRIPVITPIADVRVSNTGSLAVNVTSTDDASDHVRLFATGLPAFATFTDNGNGTGVINITPSIGSLGIYPGVTIIAKDNSDSSSSVNFSIYVVDANIASTYVNFTDLNNTAPAPWNNMSISYLPFAGTTVTNLKDDGNTNTGIAVTLNDQWYSVSTTGVRRRNGSEIYPESVSRAGMYFIDTVTHKISVTGLNPAKKYNFLFFSSHGFSESTLTNFTVGAQTVSLNGSYNSNKTAQLNGLVAPANGTIVINIKKDVNAVVGLLTSMVIQSYTPGTPAVLSPTDLRVLDYTASTTVSLQWQDRADNETGYEVWRALNNGSYSLLTTLAANTTSYNNTGLALNATYNYIVRAKNGTTYSNYSNPVRGHTYASTVFINVNSNSVAPTPWNNLNWIYGVGAVWNNFNNEAGTPTNIGMVQPVKIDGMVYPGATTGNNSGVFPDNVMYEGWGLFPGLTSYVKLTGMNISKTYDLTLFSSITGVYWDNTTAYTINGKTCLLNSINNTTGTLTMFDVVPDQNGEVVISWTTFPGATWGLLGAVVVKGYDKTTDAIPAVPGGKEANGDPIEFTVISTEPPATIAATNENVVTNQIAPQVEKAEIIKPLSAYPNPFQSEFTLSVPLQKKDNIDVTVSDVTGRVVYQKKYENLAPGNNFFKIHPGTSAAVSPGLYVVQVTYLTSGDKKVFKLVKE